MAPIIDIFIVLLLQLFFRDVDLDDDGVVEAVDVAVDAAAFGGGGRNPNFMSSSCARIANSY